MTDAPNLDALLLAAYPARHRLNGEPDTAWQEAVIALTQAGLARDDLIAKRDALAAVENRCTVSKTQRQALDEALDQMPA